MTPSKRRENKSKQFGLKTANTWSETLQITPRSFLAHHFFFFFCFILCFCYCRCCCGGAHMPALHCSGRRSMACVCTSLLLSSLIPVHYLPGSYWCQKSFSVIPIISFIRFELIHGTLFCHMDVLSPRPSFHCTPIWWYCVSNKWIRQNAHNTAIRSLLFRPPTSLLLHVWKIPWRIYIDICLSAICVR